MTRRLGSYTDQYGEPQHHSHAIDTLDAAMFEADLRAWVEQQGGEG